MNSRGFDYSDYTIMNVKDLVGEFLLHSEDKELIYENLDGYLEF